MKAQAFIFESPLDYGAAFELQSRLHAERVAERIPDTLLLVQHPAVVTLGRRGRDNFLLSSPEELAAEGIGYHQSTRGGDITCHGPGQWVLYPIIRLQGAAASAHGYLWILEETAIRSAADFAVTARRRAGMNGAWTGAGKIAAIGFHIKRWVTMHGMSFNVEAVPRGFAHIVACGLQGEPVACLRDILGASCPSMAEVAERLLANFGAVCEREVEIRDAQACEKLLG
jgi:lipoyl(octanoyl) transferase